MVEIVHKLKSETRTVEQGMFLVDTTDCVYFRGMVYILGNVDPEGNMKMIALNGGNRYSDKLLEEGDPIPNGFTVLDVKKIILE